MNIFAKIKMKINNIIKKKINYFKNNNVYSKEKQKIFMISCNCIGGLLYHKYSMEFLSPAMFLIFEAKDFTKCVNNLIYYLAFNLQFMENFKEYPLEILGDKHVHFFRCNSLIGTKIGLHRIVKRTNFDNIVLIFSDSDGFDHNVEDLFFLFKRGKAFFSHCKNDNSNVYFAKKDFDKNEVDILTCFYGLVGERVFEYCFDFKKSSIKGGVQISVA